VDPELGRTAAAGRGCEADAQEKEQELTVPEKKYTLSEAGPRIEQFLKKIFDLAGFTLNYAVAEGETPHPDFENPDLLVRFSGADVDLLLANKAELLLALEQLTMEALDMSPEEHSRVLRCQRLSRSAHRRVADERARRSGAGEEGSHPVPLQPDEQPGTPHSASCATRRDRSAERKRRHGSHPTGSGGARRYEDSARACNPAEAAS
jgi:hypothetical protein